MKETCRVPGGQTAAARQDYTSAKGESPRVERAFGEPPKGLRHTAGWCCPVAGPTGWSLEAAAVANKTLAGELQRKNLSRWVSGHPPPLDACWSEWARQAHPRKWPATARRGEHFSRRWLVIAAVLSLFVYPVVQASAVPARTMSISPPSNRRGMRTDLAIFNSIELHPRHWRDVRSAHFRSLSYIDLDSQSMLTQDG